MSDESRLTPEHAEVLAMGDSPCWPLKHDANCESVAVDIGVGEMHSPCGCEVRWYQRALRLFVPSETVASEDHRQAIDALRGLYGLLQLYTSRDDMPADFARWELNHRAAEARRVLACFEQNTETPHG